MSPDGWSHPHLCASLTVATRLLHQGRAVEDLQPDFASAPGRQAQADNSVTGARLQIASLRNARCAAGASRSDRHAILQGQRGRVLQLRADQHDLTLALSVDGDTHLRDVDHRITTV